MEKDAQSADKYKADVYSMAKSIWIILTGDEFSFGGQYIATSEIGLSRKLKCDKYLYPLDKLLAQCTDYTESARPTAEEMKNKFEEWIQINANWSKENLMQWQEIQELLFPTIIPTHAEWKNVEDIVNVLRFLGKYESLNHMFFPDTGGLDLTYAVISHESDCIELICSELIYIVKPKKLSFEFINDEAEWNYFLLETENLKPTALNHGQQDDYAEEVYEISPAQYISLEEFENMSKADIDALKPRHVCRYLKGSFVFFHKDSVYNKSVSKYRGEHDKMTIGDFHDTIVQYSKIYHKDKI